MYQYIQSPIKQPMYVESFRLELFVGDVTAVEHLLQPFNFMLQLFVLLIHTFNFELVTLEITDHLFILFGQLLPHFSQKGQLLIRARVLFHKSIKLFDQIFLLSFEIFKLLTFFLRDFFQLLNLFFLLLALAGVTCRQLLDSLFKFKSLGCRFFFNLCLL